MKGFQEIYSTACLHKGGENIVEANLPTYLSSEELKTVSDSEFLSSMSLRIFQAGLKHSMVASKWSAFEKQFHDFDPVFCAYMSDEFIEQCMGNKDLIRHLGKLKTIRENAFMVMQKKDLHGSFGTYLADWSVTDIVGLWIDLKKQGSHLGGGSAPAFLRKAGKDTFMLTNDVVAVLKNESVVTKAPSSQRDLKAVQKAFNIWMEQSGRPLCEISRIISMAAT